MARQSRRLTDIKVKSIKLAGLHPDGDGLYLRVTDAGTKSWIYRFKFAGRLRDMGLGKYPAVGLSAARELVAENYALVKRGVDPIAARQAQIATVAPAHVVTFAEATERYISSHEGGWKNPKHRQQWRNTLSQYAFPVIGEKAVADINTDDILRILEPIWSKKTETASRVRGRVENVLDWAKVRGLRGGENPALWRGHLSHLLPARNKRLTVDHHAAMPWADVPDFMATLSGNASISSAALQFTILTAVRTSESTGATWDEIDLDGALWIIPKTRMKAQVEFRVPLTDAAMDLLRAAPRVVGNPYIFPGARTGRPLSNMAMLELLRGLRPGLTVHGFRSSFRDWAGDCTGFPRDTIETCLAHAVESEVEAAYRRSDMIAKRRKVMEAWAAFCGRGDAPADVVPIMPRLAGQGR